MAPSQADVVIIWMQVLETVIMVVGVWVACKILGRTGNGSSLKLDQITPGGARSESERTKLLKFYSAIEEALRGRLRSCTFLSVDVVDSRQLKMAARPAAIDAAFAAYEQWARRILKSNAVWKETWTPDGLMAAFNTADEAVRAAQMLLCDLDSFNESHALARPFYVRCGIAYGSVVIFEDSKLEKVSDRSLDLTGHLQKAAEPNSILIGSIAYANLVARQGFVQSLKVVDDLTPYEWLKSRENCDALK